MRPLLPFPMSDPASFSFVDLLAFDPLRASPLAWLAVAVYAGYLVGAISLWRSGRRWSPLRALSFTLGCALWFGATGLGVDRQATELVSALLFQQLTLMVVAPPLLLMGSPGRLLLRTVPHRALGRPILRIALGGARSRFARTLLHPAVAIIVAALAFPVLYFTDAVSGILALPFGHEILLVAFLGLGLIAAAPLWAADPLPRAPSYGARLADVVIEIQIHAVFGLVMLLSTAPLFRAYADDPVGWEIPRPLDQAIAGGLAWSYGELPLLIVLIVTLSKWRRSEMRSARHREAAEDAELARYNAQLAARALRHTAEHPGARGDRLSD